MLQYKSQNISSPKRKISARYVIIIHTRVIQTNKHTCSPLNPDNEGIEGGENRERKAKTKSSSGNFCREASLAGPDGPDREMGQQQMSRKASAEPHGPACTWASHT